MNKEELIQYLNEKGYNFEGEEFIIYDVLDLLDEQYQKQLAELKAENEFMQSQVKYHTNKILNFKKQLKEKDEEISKLKSDYDLLDTTYKGTCATYQDDHNTLINLLKSNTKQVCEKIREWCKENFIWNANLPEPYELGNYVICDRVELREFLDQIEKDDTEI